ncbi:hypothetical protein BKA63DRAFT_296447 [Paraphoma chrysanthemicola]|nr:hypothetical protein BKA63DRAFT_296447 [Paraphoma chrysanthemicola]
MITTPFSPIDNAPRETIRFLHRLAQHNAASEVQFQCVRLGRNGLEARNATGATTRSQWTLHVSLCQISLIIGDSCLTALFVPSRRGDHQASALRELPACSTTALDLDARQYQSRRGGAYMSLRAPEIEVHCESYTEADGSCKSAENAVARLFDVQKQPRSKHSTQSASVGFWIFNISSEQGLPRITTVSEKRDQMFQYRHRENASAKFVLSYGSVCPLATRHGS